MNDIKKAIAEAFEKESITEFAFASVEDLKIKKEYLLPKNAKTAVIWLLPYFVGDADGNISLYARSEDYHLISRRISENITDSLKKEFPQAEFCAFTDHSPIAETETAASFGLGVIGKNHLLINKKYGSYVFINTFFCDLPMITAKPSSAPHCFWCNSCIEECPTGALLYGDMDLCLSGITQQKKSFDEKEKELISKSGCIWGCDKCQTICPMNKTAEYTPIKVFFENRIDFLTKEILDKMSDEDFEKRAFSWHGKEILYRNLDISDK